MNSILAPWYLLFLLETKANALREQSDLANNLFDRGIFQPEELQMFHPKRTICLCIYAHSISAS